ncbi:hypothetical protein [Cellulomonas sp. URHD0024]|uniref:hypothetical protein n=1 Tax=Cellulomonas sp. URHD0024 TaxID=1302620 RepID=UPI0003FA2ED5|nr:hypothetical protein [Cellulomonas sp. URHD0024]
MTLNGQIIGQAERATRTLLELHLRETGLAFETWVAVNQVHSGVGGREALVVRLVRGLKIDAEAARDTVDAVIASGLVAVGEERLTLTAEGLQKYAVVSEEIASITARLYGDVPPEDLAVAGRVLSLVTERANAELAAAAS